MAGRMASGIKGRIAFSACEKPCVRHLKPRLPLNPRKNIRHVVYAQQPGGDGEDRPSAQELSKKFFSKDSQPQEKPKTSEIGEDSRVREVLPESVVDERQARRATGEVERDGQGNILAGVNPYTLGRQARRAFDDVWSQVSNLASPTKSSFIIDDMLEPSRDLEFKAPQAASTKVLVVGATGRVGRILVRKLLLRGYSVKALVRRREGKERDELQAIPAAVEIVEGDIADMNSCQEAMRGCNKMIFCAAARTAVTGDLNRVEVQGVLNLTKAMQDELARTAYKERIARLKADENALKSRQKRKSMTRIFSPNSKKELADFSEPYHQLRWDVNFVGTVEDVAKIKEGLPIDRSLNKASAEINDFDQLVFSGSLMQRSALAEVGARLNTHMPCGEHRTHKTEGLTLRVRGDGNLYACVLTTKQGRYYARFPTRLGYLTVRLPYNIFRATQAAMPPLNPTDIQSIAIRFEARRSAGARAPAGSSEEEESAMRGAIKFELGIDWIKALPGGRESDVILVSCAGRIQRPGLTEADLQRIVRAKRAGEEQLRASGLGYTVVRPGLLVDEPGGYKALVFDQGDRISQPISAADVADICLRALHESLARNKTFDVCYEAADVERGDSMFELVVSAPDKTNRNYLRSATATLVKNS